LLLFGRGVATVEDDLETRYDTVAAYMANKVVYKDVHVGPIMLNTAAVVHYIPKTSKFDWIYMSSSSLLWSSEFEKLLVKNALALKCIDPESTEPQCWSASSPTKCCLPTRQKGELS